MNRTSVGVLTTIAAVVFGFCATSTCHAQSRDAGDLKPTTDELLALERRANEATFKGDAKFFDGMLSDRFVMLGPAGQRLDKASVIEMVAGVKCNIKDGWKLEDPNVSMIGTNTYVLNYKGTFEGTCTKNGKTEKVPSPVRAATVWIRSGNKWLAAFHGQNVIVDPANPPPAKPVAENETLKKGNNTAATTTTNAMLAKENLVWEAWKDRDDVRLEELTNKDLSFVDIFGKFTSTKTETIKLWTEHRCEVKRVSVSDGVGTLVSPNVGILTFKGAAEGTCYGQKLEGPIYGTSVYVKNGDVWKLAFTMNSPD